MGRATGAAWAACTLACGKCEQALTRRRRQMLSILVCHSYFLRLDQKQLDRAKPYPPLATLQVAAMLRRAGHRVALFDAMLAEGIQEFQDRLRASGAQLVVLYEDNYNFLSKMCLATMRRAACSMIGTARAAHARVIAAGSDATDTPEAYLSAGADVVVIGEGLETLSQLVVRLDAAPEAPVAALAADLPDVATPERTHRGRGQGKQRARDSPQPELPAWDLVDIERYRAVWRAAHGFFSLNMAASRGCSFRCAWCAKPIWGNQYLQRAAADVAAEMTHIKRHFAPDHIWFADDIFGFRVDWVHDFATAVHAADGSVPFTIQSRADLMSKRMATALRAAGCCEVWIGAESGSQRVLDAMNKGTRVGEVIAARARLGEEGIRVGFFIQLGYLGEALEDILATRQLIEQARPDDVGVSVAYPLPGTAFYDLVKAQLGAKTRWHESDDLAMMFRGTYTSDFYRAVRNLLHDQISVQRLERGGRRREAQRRALEERWAVLIARAPQFRNVSSEPAQPPAAAASGNPG